MLKRFYLLILCPIVFIILSGCKKHKSNSPVDQLPPATETGANTLGFLLNDTAWTPKGWTGGTTNLVAYYDQSYHGGTFGISTYRITGQDNKQTLGIGIDSLQGIGTYFCNKTSHLKFAFLDRVSNCNITYYDTSVYRIGKLVITKFDKTNQIISGRFEVMLFKSDCGDTIRITDGRFDLKY